MLESLLEIELAYELLREGDSKNGVGVDKHYASLKAKIEPVEKQSAEYALIQKYLKNTHASTHQEYGLKIQNVIPNSDDGYAFPDSTVVCVCNINIRF